MFFFFFFEQDIIDVIKQALRGDETLEGGDFAKDYCYDNLLPMGCSFQARLLLSNEVSRMKTYL